MTSSRSVTDAQRASDFAREALESRHVEAVKNERRFERRGQTNEPLIAAAVEAGHEVADAMGHTVDVKYDRNREVVIMQVKDSRGEEVIRQIPPEETIRMAQKLKENRSRYIQSTM